VSSKWVTRSGPSEVRWSAPGGLGIGTLTSSQSDGDLSDVTVLDIGLETDAVILGFDRYSDVSEEPGSPSAAASLDRTAALARATMSSAAAEGTSADDPELPSTLDLTEYNEDISQSTGISHTSVSIVWGAWRRPELDTQLSVGPHPYREIRWH